MPAKTTPAAQTVKVAKAYAKLRSKGYLGAVDIQQATSMSLEEIVLGLLGTVNELERRIRANDIELAALERSKRHGK